MKGGSERGKIRSEGRKGGGRERGKEELREGVGGEEKGK